MPHDPRSRFLQLPPSDRAYWRAPERAEAPLLYLAWGSRQFGHAPIFPARHDGWVYMVVLRGAPLLIGGRGATGRIAGPALLVLGPDVAFGWHDDSRRTSEILVWMWRQPLAPQIARLDRRAFVRSKLVAPEVEILKELHAHCRREVRLLDAHSACALDGIQRMFEAQVARIAERRGPPVPEQVLARARHWLEQHPDSRQPLARLADYLSLSPSTVQRLFRNQLGKSVMRVVAEIRHQEAETMIKHRGASVKETAYRLGYRRPHDFSRAFRRFSGVNPSTLRQSAGKRDDG